MEKAKILFWVAVCAGALACFGIAILAIGYKPASIGRVATIVVLVAGCIAAIWGRKTLLSKR